MNGEFTSKTKADEKVNGTVALFCKSEDKPQFECQENI